MAKKCKNKKYFGKIIGEKFYCLDHITVFFKKSASTVLFCRLRNNLTSNSLFWRIKNLLIQFNKMVSSFTHQFIKQKWNTERAPISMSFDNILHYFSTIKILILLNGKSSRFLFLIGVLRCFKTDIRLVFWRSLNYVSVPTFQENGIFMLVLIIQSIFADQNNSFEQAKFKPH